MISKFLDHMGPEVLDMRDVSGNSLFHYAVSCLDELSIYKLMELGANLMAKNRIEVSVDENVALVQDVANDGDIGLNRHHSMRSSFIDFFNLDRGMTLQCDDDEGISMTELSNNKLKTSKYARQTSVIAERLPVQEAMKSEESAHRYFNALRRLDFKTIRQKINNEDLFHEFVCVHLVAATRQVRPDIVRMLFQQLTNAKKLHEVLLFCDPRNSDETLTKTALEWAVENDDRLCTTEILHQEYECHKNSKSEGLNCLRNQLTGDELLTWTIETYTKFYNKTWAQKVLIPIFGLLPLFASIATFVYDYYSDMELTMEYYR